jgi:hypothetical protein
MVRVAIDITVDNNIDKRVTTSESTNATPQQSVTACVKSIIGNTNITNINVITINVINVNFNGINVGFRCDCA